MMNTKIAALALVTTVQLLFGAAGASAQTCNQPPPGADGNGTSAPAPATAGTRATFLAPPPPDYIIGADDILHVDFWGDDTLSTDVVVRPDGKISLRLLNEVEYDILKIDLSLVRASATHGASEAVLRALGTLARNRGHRIVAEGIETPDHLESVLELRYDAGQGYLFGRAEPTLDRQPIDLFALLSTTGQEQPAA